MATKADAKRAPGAKRSGASGFFRGVWSELKKVHWPDAKQLATYTVIVLVTIAVFAVAVFVFDEIIRRMIGLLFSI